MDPLRLLPIIVGNVAAAAAVPQGNRRPYMILTGDCWLHIFRFLSLRDTFKLGETCKRMRLMVGWYFREFFPEYYGLPFARIILLSYFDTDSKVSIDRFNDRFVGFVRKLSIRYTPVNCGTLDASTFFSLNSLVFNKDQLLDIDINYIRSVLKNIEAIELFHARVECNLFDVLAESALKLKSLIICGYAVSLPRYNTLFSQHYPALEHFEYKTQIATFARINQLKVFLEKHTQLKRLALDHRVFWTNRDLIADTNIHLDLLDIHIVDEHAPTPFDQLFGLLHTLHRRGFFRELSITFFCCGIDIDFEELNNALVALPVLRRVNTDDNLLFDLSRLTGISEMHLDCVETTDIMTVATSLTNLERLSFKDAELIDIIPFIFHSARLETIRVKCWIDDDTCLDLFAMNREREKMANARRVVLYVPEKVYLSTIWVTKNLNLSLIDIARSETN